MTARRFAIDWKGSERKRKGNSPVAILNEGSEIIPSAVVVGTLGEIHSGRGKRRKWCGHCRGRQRAESVEKRGRERERERDRGERREEKA